MKTKMQIDPWEPAGEEDEEKDALVKQKKSEMKKAAWKSEAIHEGQAASQVSDKFGICCGCAHVDGKKTKYGKEMAWCGYYGDQEKLSLSDPIIVCTRFKRAGEMELHQMWLMATLIDPPKRGGKIGFIDDDKDA